MEGNCFMVIVVKQLDHNMSFASSARVIVVAINDTDCIGQAYAVLKATTTSRDK
nr:MAG TPA: hypothetical protein [Caudoviricetes sp.]